MWDYITASVVQVGCNLLLIPSYGINGAAWSAFIGFAVVNGLRTTQAARLVGIRPFSSTLMKPLIAAMASMTLVLGIRWIAPSAGALAQITVLVACYGAVLILLGIEKDDLTVCREFPLVRGAMR
jgi:O-antigen/teichoic acid export membrane protein